MKTYGIYFAAAGLFAGSLFGAQDLRKGFENPPDSAKPHVWWHWMNGNVTREGITADLEAMKDVGIGGAQIFDADCEIPKGPVIFNSPEWIDRVRWAAQEARRLGIELCVHNCSGWSSSGGPWNTPANGMKWVVGTEKSVTGPSTFRDTLAQPPSNAGFYEDIAVLAFRTPPSEKKTMRDAAPQITSNVIESNERCATILDGKSTTGVVFHHKEGMKESTDFIISFKNPYTCRSCTIAIAGGGRWEAHCEGKIAVSEDGKTFRTIQSFRLPLSGGQIQNIAFPAETARFFRVSFSPREKVWCKVNEIELNEKAQVSNLHAKIFQIRETIGEATAPTTPDQAVSRAGVIDLTRRMTQDGKLTWDVPEGDWTILRVGYAANGRRNHPASKEGTGLECDKLSKSAMQAHFAGYVGKLVRELGPLAGAVSSGLNNVLIDSYEVGSQNWTQGFEKEFKARCGYDIMPFLPALFGRIVENADVTERFFRDFRRTIADLFAENYAGEMARLAHAAGLQFSCEPYGNCPSDDLQYGEEVDIPMGEFWPGSKGNVNIGNAKLPASIAHVWGRKFVGAESFTASPEAGKWLKDPYSIKAQGDRVYCGGINRIIYHRYCHQPWVSPNYLPGMTMGQWGTHFERTLTWWKQGKEWLTYQARCQYLLQEGQFVADAVFFCGEDAPNVMRGEMPVGYDYDHCAVGALRKMTVKNGDIVLPSGMRYRMLVLPNLNTMTPATLEIIGKLVDAGATVVGEKPNSVPGLAGYPDADAKLRARADAIWAKGVLTCGVAEALKQRGISPDFVCAEKEAHLTYIHRRVNDTEIYFLAHPRDISITAECSFRVSGKIPELWHADTGEITRAPEYRIVNGITTIPISLDPCGSVFVLFRTPESGDHAIARKIDIIPTMSTEKKEIPVIKVLQAEYGYFEENEPQSYINATKMFKMLVKNGKRTFRVTNEFFKKDPAPNVSKELRVDYVLDGNKKTDHIPEFSTFTLPERATIEKALYGIIPEKEKPAISKKVIDITDKLNLAVKNGSLCVTINNTFAGRDPIPLHVKEARIRYSINGKEGNVTVGENGIFSLPSEDDKAIEPPEYTLHATEDGSLTVRAWKPLTAKFTTASGKTQETAVTAVPAPQAVTGPWSLRFPANWGAPEQVTLDKLISWTDHPDQGVKYFSGTATYAKTITLNHAPAENERVILDLGRVLNFAEVEVNGEAYPVLWKPPFRVDITDATKKANGKISLTVKVTNLWPNRLIGDELLPEDRQWNGLALQKIPDWVKEGKKSPTGRYTFTTWHHWTAEDEPLPSGILGPVFVRSVLCVKTR